MPTPNAPDTLRTTDHAPVPEVPTEGVTTEALHAPSLADKAAVTFQPKPGETRDGPSATPSAPPLSIPGYEVLGELGRGGMGVVYRARHLALKRTVALKMLLAGGHAGPRELARFHIEAEAVARLQHPNIVQIHEVGEADGHPYCALEFVEGGNLGGKIAVKPLPAREAARLVEALARAMQLAHSRNVVHRDLKPANILLMADGTPKITDFGLARQLDSDSSATQAAAVMGTPSYMAPEQASGRTHEAGPAADVYALGAILYDCLTGRPPFKGNTVVATLEQVRTQEPVPPSRWQAGLPLDLETICLKCLRKEPETRYASAAELADDLVRYQQGEPIRARPVGRLESGLRWVRRRPLVAGLLGVVALVTVLGIAAFAWAFGQALQARDVALDEQGKTARALTETDEARKKAEDERKLADEARGRAVAAEKQKAKQLSRAESLLCVSQITEAHHQLQNHDLIKCRLALDECSWNLRGPEYDYLVHQLEKKGRTLFGHADRVTGLALSGDVKRLFSGSQDGAIKVWDLETGKEALSFRSHTAEVTSLVLAGDVKRLFSGSRDSTIKVLDLEEGR